MTDQELQQLAREYAESYLPEQDSASDMARYGRMKESSMHFLRWLTKTHCIVSREKVISEIKAAQNELNEPSKPMHKFTLGYVCGILHNIFGESIFEERSEK